jgi:hypothetical protein
MGDDGAKDEECGHSMQQEEARKDEQIETKKIRFC